MSQPAACCISYVEAGRARTVRGGQKARRGRPLGSARAACGWRPTATSSGGESLVRQTIARSRSSSAREFGVDRTTYCGCPTCSDTRAALPQILEKVRRGSSTVMTTKLSWYGELTRPPYDTFMWKGIGRVGGTAPTSCPRAIWWATTHHG